MNLYPTPSEVATPARQAALLLHAMPPADRVWSLEQLAPGHREQLAKWIGELEELGIPRDRSLIDEVLSSVPEADDQRKNRAMTPQPAPDLAVPQSNSLDIAAVRVLVSILHNEPAQLIAILLDQGPWSWESQLLAQLGPAKRSQIENIRQQARGDHRTNALAQAIVDKTAQCLRSTLEKGLDQPSQSAQRTSPRHQPRWLNRVFSSIQGKGSLA